MGFWSWVKRLVGVKDPLAGVRWISAGENPFGVEVLDCRSFSESVVAMTGDKKVAETYALLRSSSGEQHRGRAPEDSKPCDCDLRYPHRGATRDGPLFKSDVMEDKWDIYLYDGHLYFARSWTDDLVYRADIAFGDDDATVNAVEARRELVEGDPAYAIAVVDYLIRSHLYGDLALHPLPKTLADDQRQLAIFSFSQYGRRGVFGTFADSTRVRLPAVAPGPAPRPL